MWQGLKRQQGHILGEKDDAVLCPPAINDRQLFDLAGGQVDVFGGAQLFLQPTSQVERLRCVFSSALFLPTPSGATPCQPRRKKRKEKDRRQRRLVNN